MRGLWDAGFGMSGVKDAGCGVWGMGCCGVRVRDVGLGYGVWDAQG